MRIQKCVAEKCASQGVVRTAQVLDYQIVPYERRFVEGLAALTYPSMERSSQNLLDMIISHTVPRFVFFRWSLCKESRACLQTCYQNPCQRGGTTRAVCCGILFACFFSAWFVCCYSGKQSTPGRCGGGVCAVCCVSRLCSHIYAMAQYGICDFLKSTDVQLNNSEFW